ncbi:MAG: thioredoxin [Legionellales bacterium]|nr:thioredoxin [Legionellales bacterium]OUX66902.1 MAG: thioredoxin [bacterium TMED178]|tara:strand:+ start:10333 stop:10650 length:318 start_codon:yes stop_codon:yes gene_type:complete
MISVNDSEFKSVVLDDDKLVLVDFWAPWCGPCKMIAPILEEVAKDFGDKLKIVKCNVDENKESPAKFGVRGIPALMIFNQGELVGSKIGAMSKAQLVEFIETYLT